MVKVENSPFSPLYDEMDLNIFKPQDVTAFTLTFVKDANPETKNYFSSRQDKEPDPLSRAKIRFQLYIVLVVFVSNKRMLRPVVTLLGCCERKIASLSYKSVNYARTIPLLAISELTDSRNSFW